MSSFEETFERSVNTFREFSELAFHTPRLFDPNRPQFPHDDLRAGRLFTVIPVTEEVSFRTKAGKFVQLEVGDFILSGTIPGKTVTERDTPITLYRTSSEFPGTEFVAVSGFPNLYRRTETTTND